MRFLRDEDGATAIEYAMIASMFAIMAMAGFSYFRDAMSGMFAFIHDTVIAAVPGGQ
ncbi:MAG: Flp family type IVb pilin [Deltaproteobacteria bacterium]|nr:Flp family type IVb pilin [Deltaproteobacteria bacterium]